MCGICASVGDENQVENVLEGLKKLEYRGYDSSGIAYLKNDRIEVKKSVGQIKNLEKNIDEHTQANIVIGHTRWATHGKPSEENAHPHLSADGQFAMVHNGIIENYEELKKRFEFTLKSQTDTEVFVNLFVKQKGEVLQRISNVCKQVKGSYAVAILHKKENKIFFAKRNSPLYVAIGENGGMIASDISVFAKKFKFFFVVEDDEIGVLTEDSVEFFNKDNVKIEKNKICIDGYDFNHEKNFDECFMQKEINEQPIVLRNTFFKYFSEKQNIDFQVLKKFKSFQFIACGTAEHASLLGAKFIQHFCKKDARVSLASEFRYDENIFSKNCLYIFVSQSGETADTIACAKMCKSKGLTCLGVTNVPYCSLNNICDLILPTFAGKEVAVASTKAYTAQVFSLLILALNLSNHFDEESLKHFVLNFEVSSFDKNLFEEICKFKKIFFIGRGQDYVTALEGALKLKEIAYINCLGIAGGELKHGTLALVDEETLVIAISTQEKLKEKLENNILEVKARGGKVLLISELAHNLEIDFQIQLPKFEECFMPTVSIVPLQQLALFFAQHLGFNPDKPRNLAKSVTVE